MSHVIGGFGLVLLMAAFVAALAGRMSALSPLYLAMNGAGATILAWYSIQVNVWIFFVLEGTWGVVAWVSLARVLSLRMRQRNAVRAVRGGAR